METEVTKILTDIQIDYAWGNASFGKDVSKRDVIANALLKYACGYGTGFTIEQISRELGLINKKCELTTLGKMYLWAAFQNKLSV